MWTAMAKDVTQMKLVVLEDETTPSKEVIATFKTVDVQKSMCRNAEDKEKVVAIIESSFGELRLFDRMVSSTLLNATSENTLVRRMSTRVRKMSFTSEEPPPAAVAAATAATQAPIKV